MACATPASSKQHAVERFQLYKVPLKWLKHTWYTAHDYAHLMTSQATVESSVQRSERVHCARGLNSPNWVHAPGLCSHDEADLAETELRMVIRVSTDLNGKDELR